MIDIVIAVVSIPAIKNTRKSSTRSSIVSLSEYWFPVEVRLSHTYGL